MKAPLGTPDCIVVGTNRETGTTSRSRFDYQGRRVDKILMVIYELIYMTEVDSRESYRIPSNIATSRNDLLLGHWGPQAQNRNRFQPKQQGKL